MDKKFVYPGVYSVISDATNFTTDSDAQFTINTKRILSTSDLPNVGAPPVTVSNTATLDIGTITSMSVRGTSTTTVPLLFSKFGKVVTMNIPNVLLVAESGAATMIHVAGAGIPATYRPAYPQLFAVVGSDNSVHTDVTLQVNAAGDVWLQKNDQSAFTVIFGCFETTVSWISAN